MTPYRVVYTDAVHEAMGDVLTYLRDQHVHDDTIDNWFTHLFYLIDSLGEFPRRYPIAESESLFDGIEIRRAVYGEYLIFYHVDDVRQTVEVRGFRHGKRSTSETPDD